MQRITANGLTFDVDDSGEKDREAVLLLHGFPQDRTSWDEIAASLRDAGYRTIAFDQRGYSAGARPSAVSDYKQGEIVADALALLDELDVERAHIVGHDWGGAVAWGLGSSAPDRVLSLTVLSTPYPGAMKAVALKSTQLLNSWYMGMFQIPVFSEAVLTTSGPFWKAVMKGLPPKAKEHYTQRARQPGAMTAMLRWYRALPLDLARPSVDWHRITVPTLYLWGDRDPALGRAAADATADFVTGDYTFVVLPGVGHWIPESVPNQVSEALLAHLERNPAS